MLLNVYYVNAHIRELIFFLTLCHCWRALNLNKNWSKTSGFVFDKMSRKREEVKNPKHLKGLFSCANPKLSSRQRNTSECICIDFSILVWFVWRLMYTGLEIFENSRDNVIRLSICTTSIPFIFAFRVS